MNTIVHPANMGLDKITFRLPNDNSDYPPVDFESLWAERLSDGVFRIDNIPFFIKGISLDDTVKATSINDELWYQETMTESSNSTLRIIVFGNELHFSNVITAVQDDFKCSVERSGIGNLISVNVADNTDFDRFFSWLDQGEEAQEWTYEVGAYRHQD